MIFHCCPFANGSLLFQPLPIQIKEEPIDEEYGDENDIDPSMFLDNSHVDKKDEIDGSQPQSFLQSLGLREAGVINPLSFLVSDELY